MVGIRVYLVLVNTTIRWQTNPKMIMIIIIIIIMFLFLLTKTFTFNLFCSVSFFLFSFFFFLTHWRKVTSNCVLLIQYGHWLYLLLSLNGGSDDQSQQLNAVDTRAPTLTVSLPPPSLCAPSHIGGYSHLQHLTISNNVSLVGDDLRRPLSRRLYHGPFRYLYTIVTSFISNKLPFMWLIPLFWL